MDESNLEYAGFWIRTWATIIDTFLIIAITFPVLIFIYGWAYFDLKEDVAGPADFIITWIFPAVAVIWFWTSRQATPGKMALSIRVLDAKSGKSLSVAQSLGRYLAYFISGLPLGLGLLWVAFDRKKQGWHDKLAGTVVVRSGRSGRKAVEFSN